MKQVGRRSGPNSWLVEPYRQVKLGLMFLLVNLLFSVLIVSLFSYYLLDMYEAMTAVFEFTKQETSELTTKFTFPLIMVGILVLLFIGTTLMVSIKYTHQIYGPLVSIRRFLDQLLVGEKPRALKLRESDQLKELADKLNKVSEIYSQDERQSLMVPIHKFIDELAAGKSPARINFREDDSMSMLAEKLNNLADSLQKK